MRMAMRARRKIYGSHRPRSIRLFQTKPDIRIWTGTKTQSGQMALLKKFVSRKIIKQYFSTTTGGWRDRIDSDGGDKGIDRGQTSSPNNVAGSEGGEECEPILPRTFHAVIMPGDSMLEGDLVLLTCDDNAGDDGGKAGRERRRGVGQQDVLPSLVEAHRTWNAAGGGRGGGGAACTMLFAEVGADDGNGVPMKESPKKAKWGMLSRSEEDAEYVGLSSLSLPNMEKEERRELWLF
jgi:hypothetical protein